MVQPPHTCAICVSEGGLTTGCSGRDSSYGLQSQSARHFRLQLIPDVSGTKFIFRQYSKAKVNPIFTAYRGLTMRWFRILPVFMLSICSFGSGYAATVTIGSGSPVTSVSESSITVMTADERDISQGATALQVTIEYNIFVDGDLFLDYSVFSYNEDLFIGRNISITGETVTIFSFSDIPIMPNLSNTTTFANPDNNMSELGNVLLFSETLILSGVFEATGSLYIGDYSSLQLFLCRQQLCCFSLALQC